MQTSEVATTPGLDTVHHVAVPVEDLDATLRWYLETFVCRVLYKDETWALLEFANTRLAFVRPDQHPMHIAIERPDAQKFGPLRSHRDGVRYTYISDPSGNTLEILAPSENEQ